MEIGAPVFSTLQRTDSSRRRYGESCFAFLDRASRTGCDEIRILIEEWVQRFPEKGRSDIRGRICSGADYDFDSAFFELFIHELLTCTGHQIIRDPDTECGRHPDFLATGCGEPPTFVEATVATEISDSERKRLSRLSVVLDAIERRVDHRGYALSWTIEGDMGTSPRVGHFCKPIQEWINTITDDDASAGTVLPYHRNFDGLEIGIDVICKSSRAGDRRSLPVVGAQVRSRWGDSEMKISECVKDKADYYGSLGRPYIIAVNCIGEFCDLDDIEEAVFGDTGLWPYGSLATTGVSSVLTVHRLYPWTLSSADVRIFHNPNATHPYEGVLTQLPEAIRIADTVHNREGLHPRQWLGL